MNKNSLNFKLLKTKNSFVNNINALLYSIK